MFKRIIRLKGIQLGLTLVLMLTATTLFSQGVDYAMKPKNLNYKGEEWVKGLVTFQDGKTIQCEFSYNPQASENHLKIKENDEVRTATVSDVKSFAYYDEATLSEHKYFSFSPSENKKMFVKLLYKDAFYSILGGISILNKTKVTDKTEVSDERQYQKFLIDIEKGLMYDLNPSTLNSLMHDREKEISQFISEHKLQFKNVYDYTLVIREYERLTK